MRSPSMGSGDGTGGAMVEYCSPSAAVQPGRRSQHGSRPERRKLVWISAPVLLSSKSRHRKRKRQRSQPLAGRREDRIADRGQDRIWALEEDVIAALQQERRNAS